jgi:acyl-coenzyme A synthetase/AMP-(fatty) acid ligase
LKDLLTDANEDKQTYSELQFTTPIITDAQTVAVEEKEGIFSLIYSSGTSGEPKGIIVSRRSWRLDNLAEPNFFVPNVIMSYSALAHGMVREEQDIIARAH